MSDCPRPCHGSGESSVVLLCQQIPSWLRQDDVTDRLVIFDVAGAAAKVSIERLGNCFLEIRPRDRLLRQPLQQNLTSVQKTRGAITALKREMLNKGFL